MTEDGAAGGTPEDERAARLAALLSVDISTPLPRPDTAVGQTPVGQTTPEETTPEETTPEETTGPVAHLPAEDRPITEALVRDDDVPAAPPVASVDPVEAPPVEVPTVEVPTVEVPGRRWRAAVSFGVLGALIIGGLGLAYAGSRILRSSTEGQVVSRVTDPGAPGYEALVESTPTLVLFHDRGDGLDSITVLTLPDPDGSGGGVVLVPRRTVVDLPVFGENPVEIAYDLGDERVGAEGVGLVLGAAMAERVVLDDQRWADLVAPVAPIEIDNPNELTVDGEVRFPLGDIELEPEDVGPYLAATVDGESDLARLFRHQIFWEAWLDAVARDGSDAAVPGEIDNGVGRFVRTIAGGESVIETLPVEPAASDAYGEEPAFVSDADAVAGLVRTLVPFPLAPAPGSRARVRVLNGTEDTTRAIAVAADLTPAGVEIVLVGNAVELGRGGTTVSYAGDEFRDEAEAIAELLGVGQVVVEERPSDAVDITVTLGADYE